jgi:hypothetical protein
MGKEAAAWLRPNTVLQIVTAILFATIAIVATRGGMVYVTDSHSYAYAAQKHTAGLDMMTDPGLTDNTYTPLTLWPGGYPWTIARGLQLGLSPDATTRLINIAAYALIAISMAHLTRSLPAWSRAAALIALALCPGLLLLLPMVLSELLFLALLLGAMVFMQPNRRRGLVVAGCLLGLAGIVRYAGIPFVGASIWLVWWHNRKRGSYGRVNIYLFTILASSPLAAWMFRNAGLTGKALGPHTVGNSNLTPAQVFSDFALVNLKWVMMIGVIYATCYGIDRVYHRLQSVRSHIGHDERAQSIGKP